MATSHTFTLTFTCDSKIMPKAIAALAKYGIAPHIELEKSEPVAPRVYDASTCESIPGAKKLTKALDPLRGKGMLQRVADTFGIKTNLATTIVSAEAAARNAERDILFIVPDKAEAVKAVLASIK